MKCTKQTSGVGNYLKYHKEKSTGGKLPNVVQQTQPEMPPSCEECLVWEFEGCLKTYGSVQCRNKVSLLAGA